MEVFNVDLACSLEILLSAGSIVCFIALTIIQDQKTIMFWTQVVPFLSNRSVASSWFEYCGSFLYLGEYIWYGFCVEKWYGVQSVQGVLFQCILELRHQGI